MGTDSCDIKCYDRWVLCQTFGVKTNTPTGPLEEGTVLQLETAADSAACGTFLIPDETMLLEFNNYQDIYTVSNVNSDLSCKSLDL